MHASERLYADASQRTERQIAKQSAFLAAEEKRVAAEIAAARRHTRGPRRRPAPAAELFANPFDDRPRTDSPAAWPLDSSGWRETAVETTEAFRLWAAHQRLSVF